MCLTIVSKIYKRPIKGEKFGWKMVRMIKGEKWFRFPFFNDKTFGCPCDTWLKSTTGTTNSEYPEGFHIFLTREAARQYKKEYKGTYAVVVKVKYDNVVTEGIQKADKCVVARKMLVMDPSKK